MTSSVVDRALCLKGSLFLVIWIFLSSYFISLHLNDAREVKVTIIDNYTYDGDIQDVSNETNALFSLDVNRAKDVSISKDVNISPKNDWERIFKARQLLLRQKCQDRKVIARTSFGTLYDIEKLKSQRFIFCIPSKVGSTSWRRLLAKLGSDTTIRLQEIKVMVIRNPLDRLTSAYRDKYVNGEPIHRYLERKKIDKSGQSMTLRWVNYWLPALLHKGLIKPSPAFLKSIGEHKSKVIQFRNTLEKFMDQIIDTEPLLAPSGNGHGIMTDTSLRLNVPQEFARKFGAEPKSTFVRSRMPRFIENAYPHQKQQELLRQFWNVSFSFLDFLKHVIWTYDFGLDDRHWSPVSELCNLCRIGYEYIIHMENAKEESDFVLQQLKSDKTHHLMELHKSIGDSSFASYYKDIPKGIMKKILDIYKYDFELFEYSQEIKLTE